MKRIAIRALVPTLSAFFAALAFCLPQPSPGVAEDQKVQVIERTAKKYEYSPSPFHVKAGTKVQLKITATDHDHGFKIANVPDGSEPNSKPGLVFPSAQSVGSSKRERRPRSNSSHKLQALIRLNVVTLAVSATEA